MAPITLLLFQVCTLTFFAYFYTENGSVYTWGLGDFGQIGNGQKDGVTSPYHVRSNLNGLRVNAIAAGGRSSFAVLS